MNYFMRSKIFTTGLTTKDQFVKAVIECIQEMIEELKIQNQVNKYLKL